MKDYLISMFIDDELDLDEKIEFVETVRADKRFGDEAVELLEMEQELRMDLGPVPEVSMPEALPEPRGGLSGWLPDLGIAPLAGFAAAMALVAAVFLLRPEPAVSLEQPYRFVIYRPGADQAEIVGTFTNWSPVPMRKIGTSGYWEVVLPVSAGEHRYSYLVEDGRQIADPTVLTREQDDFGGENSILLVDAAV